MNTIIKTKRFVAIVGAAILSLSMGHAQDQLFYGIRPGLPATIECEQYDQSMVNNPGFCDSTLGNSGTKFRDDTWNGIGVDIFKCSEYGGTQGYCVGNVQYGEWLKYSFYNPEAGSYRFKVRARSAQGDVGGTAFTLQIVGDTSKKCDLIVTSQSWENIEGTIADVPAGNHTLELLIGACDSSHGAFFDYITIYKTPPSIDSTTEDSVLSLAGIDLVTGLSNAVNNRNTLQTAINNLPDGHTLKLPSGRFYIAPLSTVVENAPNANLVSNPPEIALGKKVIEKTNLISAPIAAAGMKFTVGANPLKITQLGRWVAAGNSTTHHVKILDSNHLELTQVDIITQNQTADTFVYAHLATPIILASGDTYYLVTDENATDSWYFNANKIEIRSGVISNVRAIYQSTSSSPWNTSNNPNVQCYSLVNMKYTADAATLRQGVAVHITKSNVKIKGTLADSNSTTLVAANRDTTILFCGEDGQPWSAGSTDFNPVHNILLEDITFEGSPTINGLNVEDTSAGVMDETGSKSPIGSLVAFGGTGLNEDTQYSKSFIVRNCTFKNPSTAGIWLGYAKDVLIKECKFNYFDGIAQDQANALKAWCGIVSQSAAVRNVAVLGCIFNGNKSWAATGLHDAADYSADGLVWLQNGGGFVVEGCTVKNYRLEACQLSAGPYTVVGNIFQTLSKCGSATALHTYVNHNEQSLSIPGSSLYSVFCFVNNSVTGGSFGVSGPVPQVGAFGHSPYDLIYSANKLDMPGLNYVNGLYVPSTCLFVAYARNVVVTGNVVANTTVNGINGGAGRGIQYSVYDDTSSCSEFRLLAKCNDFQHLLGPSFFLQDGNGKLVESYFSANNLGSGMVGYGEYYGTCILLLNDSYSQQPTIILNGNDYYYDNNTGARVINVYNNQCNQIYSTTGHELF